MTNNNTDDITCGRSCGHEEPYGFVPECGCPVHDPEDIMKITPEKEDRLFKFLLYAPAFFVIAAFSIAILGAVSIIMFSLLWAF